LSKNPLGSISKTTMTSPSPLLYDTYYHIYNRGNNRENIFMQESNYTYFMKLYSKYINPIADTFAYCLLRNHFHLLLRIKSEEELISNQEKTLKVSSANNHQVRQGNSANQSANWSRKPLGSTQPSQQFSNFFNAYAKTINNAYGRTGSLFQHPFGRVPIKTDRQFWNVIAYIHQNPQKHKLIKDFRDWKWSSYGIHLSDRPTSLNREVVMDWFGGRQGYLDLHAQWVSDTDTLWFTQ
jgi:putative transposase